jgi:hypothetical protein
VRRHRASAAQWAFRSATLELDAPHLGAAQPEIDAASRLVLWPSLVLMLLSGMLLIVARPAWRWRWPCSPSHWRCGGPVWERLATREIQTEPSKQKCLVRPRDRQPGQTVSIAHI